MAAFQNAIDLRFAVADLVGNRSISDVLPRLIEMAEVDLNSRLRTRHQIVSDTLHFDEGVCPLPPDYMELISVCPNTSRGRRYSVDGFNLTVPGYSGDMSVTYYAKIPTLSYSPTSCNWLLRQHPNVYLYGVGLQAAKFLRNPELAVQTSSLYAEAIQLLRIDDERARYAVTSVRVRGQTP